MSINLECYTLVTKGELVPNELVPVHITSNELTGVSPTPKQGEGGERWLRLAYGSPEEVKN